MLPREITYFRAIVEDFELVFWMVIKVEYKKWKRCSMTLMCFQLWKLSASCEAFLWTIFPRCYLPQCIVVQQTSWMHESPVGHCVMSPIEYVHMWVSAREHKLEPLSQCESNALWFYSKGYLQIASEPLHPFHWNPFIFSANAKRPYYCCSSHFV